MKTLITALGAEHSALIPSHTRMKRNSWGKTRIEKKKNPVQRLFSNGKFTPCLNVINISTKNSNARCANRNRQLFLMVVYDLLPFVRRNAVLYSLLWLLSLPFREVNFILIIRRLSSVSKLFEDTVSLGSDTNWRLTQCPNKGSKYSLCHHELHLWLTTATLLYQRLKKKKCGECDW